KTVGMTRTNLSTSSNGSSTHIEFVVPCKVLKGAFAQIVNLDGTSADDSIIVLLVIRFFSR
ncbi:hypothetical protein, partial [Alkalibacillus haloalkaliphilus]|uniref:hypothetical protein n=1 Tax=Alkalibacillus haloalkaliphilus TaxID=94136 RepID=UPI002936089F